MQEFNFLSPNTLEQACQMLTKTDGRIIAGGTDIIPQLRNNRIQTNWLIDLSYLNGLRYIKRQDNKVLIGALTTYTELIESPLLQVEAPLLVQAAAMVGARQTRNRGTLGGNIANASPAGDIIPPLLSLDANVTLVSAIGERIVLLSHLLKGPGETTIAQNEIISHVSFERLPAGTKSVYLKIGKRHGMAISVASAALVVLPGAGNTVREVRIALGSVAPTAIRCYRAEAVLKGRQIIPSLIEDAVKIAVQECSPISDIRGTADYRRQIASVLVRRGLQTTAGM
jgi:xanthine dehydrogenase FAD-binding subunit